MSQFLRRVFAIVLIVGLAAAVAYSVQILLLAFAGILLAVLLRAAGTWLHERAELSIAWCMTIVLVAFGTTFFGTILLFGVQIVNQADQLFWAVSQAYSEFHGKLAAYHVAGGIQPGAGGLNLEAPAKAAASSILWIAAATVMVLFLGVYLSTSPGLYTDLFLSFFRGKTRTQVSELLDSTASALRWWLAGQLISMSIVGLITTFGLLIVGAPMAIPLGVLSMLLTFVPYIGAIASGIPAVLLAFTRGSHMALWVVLCISPRTSSKGTSSRR
jgi:predicted PurR-regulated permease PerM